MSTIRRPHATIAYDAVGEGPTVVLGHSHLTTLEQPAAVVEHLRPFFARCVGRASR